MGAITRAAANNFTTGGIIQPAAINDTSVASLTELENVAAGGAMTLISEQTASASASISFTSGIDSTYPIYRFEFINIRPATNTANFTFQADTGTNTNYNQTITSTNFQVYHNEAGSGTGFDYLASYDQAQGTAFQDLAVYIGNGADECVSGTLQVFNPSSTTFVKHFIARINSYNANDFTSDYYIAGYFNTTTAITRVQFKMSSGNIGDGTIKLYGISGS